jgi:hypothetical protein
MWRCVDPGVIDVSEERIASIFMVEKSGSGEPASAGGCRSTQRHIPEEDILHSHRCENLKSYEFIIYHLIEQSKSYFKVSKSYKRK